MNSENPDKIVVEKNQEKKSTWKDIVKEIVIFVIIAFGIVLPFRMYVAEPYLVDGRSMDPTFKTGDYLIVNKILYRYKTPERNTVLVFKYPNDPKKSFIKRVIGLPGETVEIKGNTVTIKNKENPEGLVLDQSYVIHTSQQDIKRVLSEDEYFVMGDNRTESFDSRAWGPLNKKYVSGEPLIRLWPLNKIELLPGILQVK
ncbi:MAG: signal peptidase I [Minisyncoccia bacterium]